MVAILHRMLTLGAAEDEVFALFIGMVQRLEKVFLHNLELTVINEEQDDSKFEE